MKSIKGFAITFLVCGCLMHHVGFLKNTSASLPYRYFVWFPHLDPRPGDITTFVHPTYGRVIKRLVGIENNVVAYDEAGVLFVAGKRIGSPLAFDYQGQPLQTIPPGLIPHGYVFCAGDHTHSLDSRYPMMGLIHQEALQGRLWGIP